jgi:hypothetical protein
MHAELRRTRPGLEARLIFMTGATVTPSVAQFLAGVENPRIEKPFSARAIRDMLDELSRK